MNQEPEYQIIYSLRIMEALVGKGEFPVKTLPNPKNTNFNCWVFKNTNEFREKLAEFQEY